MKKGIRKAVMAVITNDNNQILIGSSPRDGGYKFPQGGLEPGEDAVTGIKRELQEELGLQIKDADIVYVSTKKVRYYYPPEDPYFIFRGQELEIVRIRYNHTMQLIPQDDEFEELLWIAPAELVNFNTNFRLLAYKKALEICRLL